MSSIQYFRDEYLDHLQPDGCPFDPAAATLFAAVGAARMSVQTNKPGGAAARRAEDDLVTLTIDGVEVSVPKGDAGDPGRRAASASQIPRFCDHPLLEPVGACRQCLVDVADAGNGRPCPSRRPRARCRWPTGMVVNTQLTSPVANKAQQGIMEFLLINHPLDCPVCDKGGECPLQNQAMSNGRGETRFTETKRDVPQADQHLGTGPAGP